MSKLIKAARLSKESVLVGANDPTLVDEKTPTLKAKLEQMLAPRLEQLKQQCQQEKQQAYDRGFQEGKELGLKLSEGKVAEVIERFSSMIHQLQLQRKSFLKKSESAVLQLAVAVAEKVIGDNLQIDKQVVLRMIRRGIEHLIDKSNLSIKVNPEELELVRQHQQDWLALGGDGQLTISADPSVGKGECVIETDSGQVNARIEKQLDILKQAILESVHDE